jgi:hypothetical protein
LDKEKLTEGIKDKLSPFEEKKLRRDVEILFSECKSIKNPNEKLEELEIVLSACPKGELQEAISSEIKATKDFIAEAVKEAVNLKETFQTIKVEELKEGIERLHTDTAFFERQSEAII